MGKIIVAGIGPGSLSDITPAVTEAIASSDVVVGYKEYFRYITPLLAPGTECIDTGMKKELERAELAFQKAEEGKTVTVISSGDAGIYGMAPLIYELKEKRGSAVEVETLPGVSAFQKAASLLGAPIGHDLCLISLSDLLTPWVTIEKRIRMAAEGDFVTCVYNPRSRQRFWQLFRLKELFLKVRAQETPVGLVTNAGREDETVKVSTLADFDPEDADMCTVVVIGNSQSYLSEDGHFITPRGYFGQPKEDQETKPGQEIMIRSFRTIERELRHPDIPLDRKWALLHAIHTTADFEMEELLYTDPGAVETLYRKVKDGTIKTIISDVTMVTSGVRKGALSRLGIEAKTYLMDPRVKTLAEEKGITRTQAGIRLAVADHPDGDALFAFGNAPTALMELATLIQKGAVRPAGIIAAPVGFVHVIESKQMIKPFSQIPKIIIDGRKGGSNLAATLVNAVLTLDDAELLRPGRDV